MKLFAKCPRSLDNFSIASVIKQLTRLFGIHNNSFFNQKKYKNCTSSGVDICVPHLGLVPGGNTYMLFSAVSIMIRVLDGNSEHVAHA